MKMKLLFHTDTEHSNAQQWTWLTKAEVGTDEHEFFISMLVGDFSKVALKEAKNLSGLFVYTCESSAVIKLEYKRVDSETIRLYSPF